jgi:hypothetical protein
MQNRAAERYCGETAKLPNADRTLHESLRYIYDYILYAAEKRCMRKGELFYSKSSALTRKIEFDIMKTKVIWF